MLELHDGLWTLDNLPIYARQEDDYLGIDKLSVSKTDNGYLLEVDSTKPVTLDIPASGKNVIVGDQYQTAKVPSRYYYGSPVAGGRSITCPFVHLISDECHSFVTPGECTIDLGYRQYEIYVCITITPNDGKIRCFCDIAANYLINLQRIPVKHNIVNTLWTIPEMADAIYYGSSVIKPPDCEQVKEYAKEIQTHLKKRGILPVIIGSLAEHLNGIDCPINDCDLMLKDTAEMIFASELLKDLGYKINRKNEKWIRAIRGTHIVDLTWDNYRLLQPPHYVETSHGFRFFTTNGLLWLSLLNLYELHQTDNPEGYPRNDKVLYELMEYAKDRGTICNISIPVDNFLREYNKNCEKILEDMSGLPLLYLDTRTNEPFKVNCFGSGKKRVYGVINVSGVSADCRIITDFRPEEATWIDVGEEKRDVRIEISDEFSILYVDQIQFPGIIRAG